ncbi:hypothetical protein HOT99_gp212 [Caulobacter phage CcrBL10]|uniref:Uncharacterized protein n=1 Tax=Caulobacter phage CcrBL10 TaxID=2283269 RepID=A0A385EBP2_9CAUD|nr:hypothetical protein HOT99_gp212 [Caulobacter phage CcrBL10]AXQ68405.1 hypothetical protein CcrBL10_gp201c [Caulobacter phage CcrBL10]
MKFWSAYGAAMLVGVIQGFVDGYHRQPPMITAALFSILLVAIIARASEKPF